MRAGSNNKLETKSRLLFSRYSSLYMRQQLQRLDFREQGDSLKSSLHATFFPFLFDSRSLGSVPAPPQPQPPTHVCVVSVWWCWRGGGDSGRRRVRAGEDVSSLTPILSLTWRCIESPCKAHVITPPPRRMRRTRG